MQHDRKRRINMNKFAVHFYVISRGRLCAEVRANAAVDRDASSSDQLIAMPAGTDSSRGKEAIETHGGGKVVNTDWRSVNGWNASRVSPLFTYHHSLRRLRLHVRLRLWKVDDFLTFLPLTALLQELDTLEALQHVAPGGDRAGSF